MRDLKSLSVLRIRFEASPFVAMEVRQCFGSDGKAPVEWYGGFDLVVRECTV